MVNFKVFGTKLRIYPQTAKFGFRVGLGSFGRFGSFGDFGRFGLGLISLIRRPQGSQEKKVSPAITGRAGRGLGQVWLLFVCIVVRLADHFLSGCRDCLSGQADYNSIRRNFFAESGLILKGIFAALRLIVLAAAFAASVEAASSAL